MALLTGLATAAAGWLMLGALGGLQAFAGWPVWLPVGSGAVAAVLAGLWPSPAAASLPPVAPLLPTGQADHDRLLSQMRSILEYASVGLVITVDRRMVIVSRAFCTMFGYDEAQLIGQPGRLIYPSDEAYAEVGPRVVQAFAERGQFDAEMQMMRRDGGLFWCQVTGRPVDRHNPAAGTMWVLYDVTAQRHQRERLEWASSHDPLTGLLNRAGFDSVLQRLVAPAATLPGQPAAPGAALLVLDLDRFKQVNDSAGHAAGDQLLRDLAALMTRRLRQGDVVARLGGDEFAVLLQDCSVDGALSVAHGLREQVRSFRLQWQGELHAVGVSIGVLNFRPGRGDALGLLTAADNACYEAKKAGRDAVRLAVYGDG